MAAQIKRDDTGTLQTTHQCRYLDITTTRNRMFWNLHPGLHISASNVGYVNLHQRL